MCVYVILHVFFMYLEHIYLGKFFVPPIAVDSSDQDFIFICEGNTRTHVWK